MYFSSVLVQLYLARTQMAQHPMTVLLSKSLTNVHIMHQTVRSGILIHIPKGMFGEDFIKIDHKTKEF